MYVIPAQRGAKWHLSKILERFSTSQRAKVDAGLCLATLCLLSAHLAMTPSIVRGQTQNDYGQYFQQIPEAEETIAAITGGLIDSRPSRAAESSFVNQTSSRRESRGLAAAHSPGVSDKPSDENVVSLFPHISK